ncbi:phosphate acetyltransferase [Flavihumibacter sp. ZG627]|uniref:phosphate acetyltransferase n=1 Tax=Flavihumibacter sp. ZG627 TaxID=1463156 RepID=UPI00057F0ABC|nr:phosphate acetyltransferase [Flavihumibacter sp. ZG627]KIC89552.1 phosphate acetyltransferase [Flavihumibacter sp. ZG627]
MTRTIFIATAEPYSGKSIVALGVVNMLLGKARKVGYFKPIINDDPKEKKDIDIETLVNHFGLQIPYEDTYAFTRQQAMRQMESESRGELIETVIRKVKKLEERYDFTVIEGSDYLGEGTAFEFETNITIAKNLNAAVIIVVSGSGKSTAQFINSVQTVLRNFRTRDIQVLAVVANKVKKEMVDDIHDLLSTQLNQDTILAVIPENKDLQNPTMKEIYEQIGGKLILGENELNNQVDNFVTGAMQLPSFLNYITENCLIVTPGDRGDIIIGAIQANLSANYPKIAGIVLTAGIEPDKPVLRLVEGLPSVLPIISVQTGTFGTTTQLGSINSRITADNKKKIQLAISTFEKYVDVKALDEKIITFKPEGITPHMFQYQLAKRAKSKIKHIVLPEGNDDRIIKAAARLINQELVELTILGDPAEIAATVKRLGLTLDLQKIRIINPAHSEHYEGYVETLYELRKNKNVTMEMAHDLMTDVSYFGTMMVYKGHADGMVSGAIHTTQHTIRPALQFVKTKPGISTVSSVFFMCLPDRVSVFGDCAVNPDPTAEQLAEIAISSAESSQRFGIEPRIAMLSYSSGSSGEGADVEKVRQATAIVKQKRPDLKVEGPIQYDAAVDPSVGRQKLPGSEVAGQASVLIFPDLNTGNNTYKAVQRETGALAIGPMLQGLNKPINDLSRGCTVDDIFNTVIITAIQAQEV